MDRIWNEYKPNWDTISFSGLDYSMTLPLESTIAFVAPSWIRNRLKFGKPYLQVKLKNQQLRPWSSCCVRAGTCPHTEAVLKTNGLCRATWLTSYAAGCLSKGWVPLPRAEDCCQIASTTFPKMLRSVVWLTMKANDDDNDYVQTHTHVVCFHYFVKLPQVRLHLLKHLFYTLSFAFCSP